MYLCSYVKENLRHLRIEKTGIFVNLSVCS